MSEAERPIKKQNFFKRHKIITGILALIIIVVIASSASGSNKTPANTASASSSGGSSKSTNTQTASTPGLNQPAADGKFQFVITAFQCGVTQIEQSDDQYETATPQGQYCEMSLTVKNISTVAQDFDDSSQYIYSAGGTQYSADNNGTIAANPSSSQFMLEPTVNPGVSISGVIAFDIPKGAAPSYAMLHDSDLSNGVKVNL